MISLGLADADVEIIDGVQYLVAYKEGLRLPLTANARREMAQLVAIVHLIENGTCTTCDDTGELEYEIHGLGPCYACAHYRTEF